MRKERILWGLLTVPVLALVVWQTVEMSKALAAMSEATTAMNAVAAAANKANLDRDEQERRLSRALGNGR